MKMNLNTFIGEQMDFQICNYCVMDNISDPDIVFDDTGRCNYCKQYNEIEKSRFISDKSLRENKLDQLINEIKNAGKEKPFDCIIGVSGGEDSTYVAYLTKQLGLRPLAIHLDNGWNSELAVENISRFIKKLNIELFTYIINWEEFKDLQIAFLKASTPDSEIPTDHAINALFFKMALKFKVKYFITGDNFRTECILPPSWTNGIDDWVYIKNVHKLFGKKKIKTFPHYSYYQKRYFQHIIKRIPILDYFEFDKKKVTKIMTDELSWQPYPCKHFESVYTRFFQGYILPHKFNIDKRKAHLSNLICSNNITRNEAIEQLNNNPYTNQLQQIDKVFVIKKLNISESEFEEIMLSPIKKYSDYPNVLGFLKKIDRAAKLLKKNHLFPQTPKNSFIMKYLWKLLTFYN